MLRMRKEGEKEGGKGRGGDQCFKGWREGRGGRGRGRGDKVK